MKRNLLFALSLAVVGLAYAASPEAANTVKNEVAQTCKCDAQCTNACECPKCPSKEKIKEAAATQATVDKQAEAAKAKA